MELDHVIVFVAGPESVAPLFPGFVLDPGIRHVGQGTCNRRVFFPRNYVEIVWIEDSEARRRSGLGGAARWAPGAPCPFVSCCGNRRRARPRAVRALPGPGWRSSACCWALHCLTHANPSSRFGRTGVRLGARIFRSTRAAPGACDVRCCAARPSRRWYGVPTRRPVRARAGAAAAEWDGRSPRGSTPTAMIAARDRGDLFAAVHRRGHRFVAPTAGRTGCPPSDRSRGLDRLRR